MSLSTPLGVTVVRWDGDLAQHHFLPLFLLNLDYLSRDGWLSRTYPGLLLPGGWGSALTPLQDELLGMLEEGSQEPGAAGRHVCTPREWSGSPLRGHLGPSPGEGCTSEWLLSQPLAAPSWLKCNI